VLLREYSKLKHPLARVLKRVIARIRGAEAGSGAVQKTVGSELVGLLPYNEVALIASGEASGDFAKGWRNAAHFARMDKDMRSKIMGALSKPLLYVLAFLGLLLFSR